MSFSHMYVDGGSASQTISSSTYVPLTGFDTAGEQSTQSGNLGTQITIASDKITAVRGVYYVDFSMSGYTDITGDLLDVTCKLYTDNATSGTGATQAFAAAAGFSARYSFGEVDAYGHLAFTGIYEVTADRCDFKVYANIVRASSENSSSSWSISVNSSSSSSSSQSPESVSSNSALFGETTPLVVVHSQLVLVSL